MIIAIDGPAAAGKGTLARALAAHLGYHFLDTGTLYRMVGLAVLRGALDPVTAARSLDPTVFDDADLRSEEVAGAASKVAAIPEVRAALVDFQRSFANQKPGAVLDGRDIGTVICPNADFKFYITASVEARAARRFQDLRDTGVTRASITADIIARDTRDAAQSAPAVDAILIDTSEMSAEACLRKVLSILNVRC
jgi:CMP/dCMP kinase